MSDSTPKLPQGFWQGPVYQHLSPITTTEQRQPKFKVGDIVEACGKKGIIQEVKEQFYFYSGDHPYYEYVIQDTTTDAKFTMAEAAITLVTNYRSKGCECGAWAVHWATDEHARWCPMFTPP